MFAHPMKNLCALLVHKSHLVFLLQLRSRSLVAMTVAAVIVVTVVDSAVAAPATLRSAVKVEAAQAMMPAQLVKVAKTVQRVAISQYEISVARLQ